MKRTIGPNGTPPTCLAEGLDTMRKTGQAPQGTTIEADRMNYADETVIARLGCLLCSASSLVEGSVYRDSWRTKASSVGEAAVARHCKSRK